MNKTLNMDLTNKTLQDVAVAIKNDVVASNTKCNTMDEMYEAVSKYVQLTKEQFLEYYKEAEEKLSSLSENHELSEEELDMVAGGGLWDWLKDHALTIGLVAATVLVATGVGAALGAGIGALGAYITGNVTIASGIMEGVLLGGAALGGATACHGVVMIATNDYKDGFNWDRFIPHCN